MTIELILGIITLVIGVLTSLWKLTNKIVITLNNLNSTTSQLSEHLRETKTDVENLKGVQNNHEVRISVLESNNMHKN